VRWGARRGVVAGVGVGGKARRRAGTGVGRLFFRRGGPPLLLWSRRPPLVRLCTLLPSGSPQAGLMQFPGSPLLLILYANFHMVSRGFVRGRCGAKLKPL
jgi:hypothetical protein